MRKRKQHPDYWYIGAVLLLLALGLMVLASASAPVGFERYGSKYFFVKRQILFGLIPGMAAFVAAYYAGYKWMRKWYWWFLAVTLVLLVLVFIPGLGAGFGTAQSWINIGSFTLQPGEFAKLTFVIFMAGWLDDKGRRGIQNFWKDVVPFLVLLAFPLAMLVLQPDMGTMVIVLAFAMIMLFAARVKFTHLAILVLLGITALAALIAVAPYRADRFMTFLHPELDPQGVGYHINQSFLAIGSGGLTGVGYGNSRQKYQYLPEVSSDSIFAVLAEEMGFVVSTLLIFLVLFIFMRGLRIARLSSDQFGMYLVVGIVSWIGIQSLVNIGAMLGLMPLTGVPLPFVSHGGSALLAGIAAVGVVSSVSRSARVVD